MTVFTRDWSAAYEAIPADTDNASEGGQRIRQGRTDVRERVNVDHFLPGTAPADKTEEGEHRKITFYGPIAKPTNVADKGFLYTKDVNSVVELFWEDESGNEIQLTAAGLFGGFTTLQLLSTLADATLAPLLEMYRNSASPADNDLLGVLRQTGEDSASAKVTLLEMYGKYLDVTAATEDAEWVFKTIVAGTLADRLRIGAGLYADGLTDPGVGKANFTEYQTGGVALVDTKPNLVQRVNTQTGAVATGTGTIPNDDTIPQNTEGTEFMTLAITPTNTNNILHIDTVCIIAAPATDLVSAALFQDSTANALAVATALGGTGDRPVAICFRHKMTAGTVSVTTFKVRGGGIDAGTYTFNGGASARLYGGVMASSITITEVKV